MEKSFIPKKAFEAFKNAQNYYNEKKSFSDEDLEILHSYFDDSFIQATELVEKSKITCYSTLDSFRKIYTVSTALEQYAIHENINFCQCDFFKNRVLDARSSLSCKHVLAVYLANIMGKVREEKLADHVFEEYLNGQLNTFLDVDTQDIF